MSIMIDTPEGIAFFRALSRKGAASLGMPGIIKVLREVYGYPGNPAAVKAMHNEYIESTLETRKWDPEYAERIQGIAQEALRRAEEENGESPRLKEIADANVQAFFESGSITETEGNDACTLIFVEVVRQRAGNR